MYGQGDAGSTTFRSLIYLPATMPHDFYSKTYISLNSLQLFVRRVFITSDLGEDFLPKWLNWVKVFVDADDLPLNVGRDSLLKSRALGKIKGNLIKRVSFSSIASAPRLLLLLLSLENDIMTAADHHLVDRLSISSPNSPEKIPRNSTNSTSKPEFRSSLER